MTDFDRTLMAAMQERVAVLERYGPPPGVELDLGQLRTEQQQRARWLTQRMGTAISTDWDRVRRGANLLMSADRN